MRSGWQRIAHTAWLAIAEASSPTTAGRRPNDEGSANRIALSRASLKGDLVRPHSFDRQSEGARPQISAVFHPPTPANATKDNPIKQNVDDLMKKVMENAGELGWHQMRIEFWGGHQST